jgi:tRNA threonylcarbamoyladenosine biosynthesis protein TsaE
MKKKITTKSFEETQEFGRKLAEELKPLKNKATVFALRGDLGGGKTTFTQGFAKGLGVKGKILSPTFNIMKRFKTNKEGF